MTIITADLTIALDLFKTQNKENIDIFSNGEFSDSFRLKLFRKDKDLEEIGTKLSDIYKSCHLDTDKIKLEFVKFLYEQWNGAKDLCDHHKGDKSAPCKCDKNIEKLKNCITDYDDDNPGLYLEKVFVWILLNKKEWEIPKIYFVNWIRFIIRPACTSIKRMLTNKMLNVNEMNDIKSNIINITDIYDIIICNILISGLSTELVPSHARLSISDNKQIDIRNSQNLNTWLDNTDQPLAEFLNLSILGDKNGVFLLNNLVYGLLLDLWREGVNIKNWDTWISKTYNWMIDGRKGTKPLEPVGRPVHRGEILCCSTPETYPGNDNTIQVSFYTRLTWPTQSCSHCGKDQCGGVLKDSIWFEGDQLKTITKTCVKVSNKKCFKCKLNTCTCTCCVPKECKKCMKYTSVTAVGNSNITNPIKPNNDCGCRICKKCKKCKKCECIDCTGCIDGTKCDCCEAIYFCSVIRGMNKDLSQISILTDGKETISCKINSSLQLSLVLCPECLKKPPCKIKHFHYPFAVGAGKGRKVFIDVVEFTDYLRKLLLHTDIINLQLIKDLAFDSIETMLVVRKIIKELSVFFNDLYGPINPIFKTIILIIDNPTISLDQLISDFKALYDNSMKEHAIKKILDAMKNDEED